MLKQLKFNVSKNANCFNVALLTFDVQDTYFLKQLSFFKDYLIINKVTLIEFKCFEKLSHKHSTK